MVRGGRRDTRARLHAGLHRREQCLQRHAAVRVRAWTRQLGVWRDRLRQPGRGEREPHPGRRRIERQPQAVANHLERHRRRGLRRTPRIDRNRRWLLSMFRDLPPASPHQRLPKALPMPAAADQAHRSTVRTANSARTTTRRASAAARSPAPDDDGHRPPVTLLNANDVRPVMTSAPFSVTGAPFRCACAAGPVQRWGGRGPGEHISLSSSRPDAVGQRDPLGDHVVTSVSVAAAGPVRRRLRRWPAASPSTTSSRW